MTDTINNTNTFDSFGLPPALLESLQKMNFTAPTPIQAQAIPHGIQGKDILGSAQTGTGKTAAFAIPLVAQLLSSPRGTALVMTPTRELAVQVIEVIDQLLGKYSTINSALLIGGESMPKQIQQLKGRPRVIVGTPGRINDHLERGTLMLHDTKMLVLDETDRMLDMGFGIQIDRVLKFVPQQRQTMLFSATLPPQIIKMSEKYLKDPVRVSVGQTNATAKKVTQEIIHVSEAEKFNEFIKQLETRSGTIIVFVKTKFGAERMAHKLNRMGHSADAIHGDLHQRKRDRVISNYRDMNFRILVATDIASRGLDIPHIEHVINYDLPQVAEDYIHRIGRTARADAEGAAISLISPEDRLKWRAIERLLNPGAKGSDFPPSSNGGDKNAPSARHRSARHGNGNNRRRRFGGGNEQGEKSHNGGRRHGGGGSQSGEGHGGQSRGGFGKAADGQPRGDSPQGGAQSHGGGNSQGGTRRPFRNRRPQKSGEGRHQHNPAVA